MATHRLAFPFLAALSILSSLLFAAPAGGDLPLKPDSIRFAVIGDAGSGAPPQFEVAQEMEKYREKVHFDFVLMLGDNIRSAPSPAEMKKRFEDPYKSLLAVGVEFYASLGNHDRARERLYAPFHMGGERYYSFRKGNAEFFALDSNDMDAHQLEWVKKALHDSKAGWKICFFHHPLYSDGKFHGSDTSLRALLEPVFRNNGVRVVLSGHDHVYERIKPHYGIDYFVMGSSGELRAHGLRESSDTAKGFDTDRAFMLMEIAGDQLFFQTISRTGETVDSGLIGRKAE